VLKPFASLFAQASFCADLMSTASPSNLGIRRPLPRRPAGPGRGGKLPVSQGRHATRGVLWIATCINAPRLWATASSEGLTCAWRLALPA